MRDHENTLLRIHPWCAGCAARRTAVVEHVVVCWLKNPSDANAQAELIKRSYELRKIPGIIDMRAGRSLPSDRPTVDDSFDVALVITFSDRNALERYQTHPLHVKAVEEVLKPLVAKHVIYDFTAP